MVNDLNRKKDFKNDEELTAYIADKFRNGWVNAMFKGDIFFNMLENNFYGDKGEHSNDMIRIMDRWVEDNTVINGKLTSIPTIHLEVVFLIKKNEVLDMIVGGKLADNVLYIMFHEGGVANVHYQKDPDDVGLIDDWAMRCVNCFKEGDRKWK